MDMLRRLISCRIIIIIIIIQRERAQSLDNEKVIDAFASVHKNIRIKLN